MSSSPSKKLAWASFFCGLASLLLLALAGIPAVIFGHKAHLATAREGGSPTSGLAVTGLVLGYLSLVLTAFVALQVLDSFALQGPIHKAHKSRAKNDCVNLVQAVGGFFDDYARLPNVPAAGSGFGAPTDGAVMIPLLGIDTTENPKGIRYFSGTLASGSPPAGGLLYSGAGASLSVLLLDPWRKKGGGVRHYYLLLDLDGDGCIPDPTDPGFTIHGRMAAAWSTGPDGRAHPDAAHRDNHDNVYSWK